MKEPARWKHLIMAMSISIAVVGVAAIVFRELLSLAVTAEIDKTESIPVTYQTNTDAAENESDAPSLPNYRLIDSTMEHFVGVKPPTGYITKEAAAEIGVRQLCAVYHNVDFNGATFEMGYAPAADGRRAVWMGFWYYEGISGPPNRYYSFRIDALTGLLHNVGFTRTLEFEDISDADGYILDEYKRDRQGFKDYALQIANELNVVDAPIKMIQFYAQSNTTEMNIIFEVTGENNQLAWLFFSPYDKTLLSVIYSSGIADMERAFERQTSA